MATQTNVEKMSGSANAVTIPVHVWDDTGATLTVATAITAAQGAAPASVLGVAQDSTPNVEQISDFAYRIHIGYRVYNPKKLTPLSAGQTRYNFDVRAKSKRLRYARELATFSREGEDYPSSNGLLVDWVQGDNLDGVAIDVPEANAGATISVASSSVDAAFCGKVRRAVGSFNNFTISGWAVGECYITRIASQQVDDDTVNLNVEWSLKDNVSDATRDSVVGITHRGHDYVKEIIEPEVDRNGNTMVNIPLAVYVYEVWPSYNHGLLNIYPPQKP